MSSTWLVEICLFPLRPAENVQANKKEILFWIFGALTSFHNQEGLLRKIIDNLKKY